MMAPKISVLMITYNQESYIDCAIESVLRQETEFSYEIVLGDDCSTDATLIKILGYQSKYPETIRILTSDENRGAHRNFIRTYKACEGEYIAVLEGDDFWINEKKLQTQIEFLETHPDCSICFHNVKTFNDTEGFSELMLPIAGDTFRLKDILKENFIPTCSVVFRNELIAEFPDWINKYWFLDWFIHIMNARTGDIGFLDKYFACYRINPQGICATKTYEEKCVGEINFLFELKTYFKGHYNDIIDDSIRNKYRNFSLYYIKKWNFLKAVNCLLFAIGLKKHIM